MSQDLTLQKCGYLRCQVEITDFILKRQKDLSTKIQDLRTEIYEMKSLLKQQEKAKELAELIGESKALKLVTDHVFSLQFSPVVLVDSTHT